MAALQLVTFVLAALPIVTLFVVTRRLARARRIADDKLDADIKRASKTAPNDSSPP